MFLLLVYAYDVIETFLVRKILLCLHKYITILNTYKAGLPRTKAGINLEPKQKPKEPKHNFVC